MDGSERVVSLLKAEGPLTVDAVARALQAPRSWTSEALETLTADRVLNHGPHGYWAPITSTINPVSTKPPAKRPAVASATDLPTPHSREIAPGTTMFTDHGRTRFGEWKSEVTYTSGTWVPGARVAIGVRFHFPAAYWAALAKQKVPPGRFLVLATAERTFDPDGVFRLPSDNGMSTLLTPTGLPIEGGIQGAISPRAGYSFRTPLDEFGVVPIPDEPDEDGCRTCTLDLEARLPDDLPPGLYRLRLDYGLGVGTRLLDLNMMAFARSGLIARNCDTEGYSPLIRADAARADGRPVEASKIRPRLPWILLKQYNSNGYRGVVADEDKATFALSSRNLIQDDVILPRFHEAAPDRPVRYSLEPHFPTDRLERKRGFPWAHEGGELTVRITAPDGTVTDLGTAPFVERKNRFLTTNDPRITHWLPPMYGEYVVEATLWTRDAWGDRYEGGGTYRFWIAKRMTLSTAVFQGQSFQAGYRYAPGLSLAPAVPADVEVTTTLYANSDPARAATHRSGGTANSVGSFGPAQGLVPVPFDAPGEYLAHILATFRDADDHLWVCSVRHAGVVYPKNSPIVARGKKLESHGRFVDRGETNSEGIVDRKLGFKRSDHINFPFRSGDVLLIASEMQKANKIAPVLMWEHRDGDGIDGAEVDYEGFKGITTTNVALDTSNGYSPHLFPEYITDWRYFYASAPRPGFMGRFLVGEAGVHSSYWPTSPNSFGHQINATANGDLPGDIYRFLGGVVVRSANEAPLYAGYMASGIVIPGVSNNNRVIAPGAEEVAGPDGRKARFFLSLNARPGAVYETGGTFVPAFQIDPLVRAEITFTMTAPDGTELVARGVANEYGYFVGREPWVFRQAGVYRYTIGSSWNGHAGLVPGMCESGGEIYVVEAARPTGQAGLGFDLPPLSAFDPQEGATFAGRSSAKEVHYAAVIPGAVLAQGVLPVSAGRFEFRFDPNELNRRIGTYDNVDRATGEPKLGRVVHLTFFSHETKPRACHVAVKLIIRGDKVHYTRV